MTSTEEWRRFKLPSKEEWRFMRQMKDKRKFCVICSCAHLGSAYYADDFNIFILGSAGGVKKIEPNIRVRGFGELTCFCYLNSTLYVVEDEQRSVYTYKLGEGHAAKSNYILEKSMLENNKNSTVPPMKSLKYEPRAIPTLDGKMVVFSSRILFHYPEDLLGNVNDVYADTYPDFRPKVDGEDEEDVEDEDEDTCYPDVEDEYTCYPGDDDSPKDVEVEDNDSPKDAEDDDPNRFGNEEMFNHSHFELFDPASQHWKELPRLMIRTNYDDNYVLKDASDSWIKLPFKCNRYWIAEDEDHFCPSGSIFSVNACSFLSNNILLVHVTLQPGIGQFLTLDMQGGGGWQAYQGWIPAAVNPHKFLVVNDCVYFSASDGYLMRTGTGQTRLRLRPYPGGVVEEKSIEMEYGSAASITLLDDSCLVRVRGGKHPKTWESSLLLDVLRSNFPDEELECLASYHLPLGQISKSFGVVQTFMLT